VDPLKYQANPEKPKYNGSAEWTTVKLRYKQPKEDKSRLIKIPVEYSERSAKKTSDNYRQATALAAFGMLLKNSAFAQGANYDLAIDLAKSVSLKDDQGYRRELIELMKIAKGIDTPLIGSILED